MSDPPPFTAPPLSVPPTVAADGTSPCPLGAALARRLRSASTELTQRWLDRIAHRVAIDANRVFPTEELLDHVPVLIEGIADHVEDPSKTVGSDAAVVAKAMELGALRHTQGFDAYQVLKEYEILGGILFTYLAGVVEEVPLECSRADLFSCAHRVYRAIALVQQATTTEYLRRVTDKLSERDARLRSFHRTLAHELRNRIGAAAGAAELLESVELGATEQRALAGVVARNVGSMRTTLEHLLELSRMDQSDVRQQRHVRLPRVAAEAARQLRDLARAHGVEVRLAPLPDVDVNAAAVELCLTNFIANGVKYSDPAKPVRWVEVSGALEAGPGGAPEVVVRVRDNGLGVPAEQRAGLFGRFFRAHEHSAQHVEGTGLGLSIVLETVRALGGRAWATFPEVGTEFAFAIPERRGQEGRRAPEGRE
jgi:signal transduction histidine kinase